MDFDPITKPCQKKDFQCEKCKKCFASKFSMQRHAEDCGVCRRRLICSHCNKSLKNQENLQKHQRVCMGNAKKVACALCDELFCSQFSLKRHVWRFHLNEQENSKDRLPSTYKWTKRYIADEIEIKEVKGKKILNFSQTKQPKKTKEIKDEYKYRYCILDEDCDY